MKISDRVIGAALLLLGVMVIWGAYQLPKIPGVRFGADLVPNLIGFGFIVFGLSIGISGFFNQSEKRLLDLSDWNVSRTNKLAALWSFLGLVLGGLLFDVIGFPLFGIIYMAALMFLMKASLKTILFVSVFVVAILYFGFSKGLLVPLPVGLPGGFL